MATLKDTQLIDRTSFIGKLELSVNAGTQQENRLNAVILDVQNDLLKKAVGGKLYAEVASEFEANGGSFTTQKWIDFFEGVNYEKEADNGETYTVIYSGFLEALKHKVYSEYLRIFQTVDKKRGA